MKITNSLDAPFAGGQSAVALGFFDGIHRGHTKVIARAAAAAERGLVPCVFTFSAASGDTPKPMGELIQTEAVKAHILEKMGVQQMFCPPFEAFRTLTPEQFAADVLAGRFHAALVTCGENFRFGKGASAGVEQLRSFGQRYGFAVEALPLEQEGGAPISSTRIRRALRAGELALANRMLGHPYTIIAPVCHGEKLGRQLQFPTANQEIPPEQVLPRSGVYATLAYVDGVAHPAVTNVGVKPTVGGTQVLAETHLLDFAADLYGRQLTVEFYAFLRPEQKFGSLEELRAAIARDAASAREICGGLAK